jgi:hypothetical protein
MKYHPQKTPAPDRWLGLEEDARISLIQNYHRRAGVKNPNPRIHAVIHLIVENQIAEGLEVVQETLDRLMAEGLDRHEAIHAIGWVLIEHLSNLMGATEPDPDTQSHYFQSLKNLIADKWKKDIV